jgi:hypothetical protein
MDRKEDKVFNLVCTVVSKVLEVNSSDLFRHTQLTPLGANDRRKLLILQALGSHGVPMPSGEELTVQLRQETIQGLCNYVHCMSQRTTAEEVVKKPILLKRPFMACLG